METPELSELERRQIQARLNFLNPPEKLAATAPGVQEAAEIGRLTAELQKIVDPTDPRRLQIQAQLDALRKTAPISPEIQKANELAQIVADLAAPGLTELQKRQLEARYTSLSRPTEKPAAVPPELLKAQRVAQITLALETPEISPLEKRQLEAELKSLSPVEPRPPAEAASLQLASAIEGAQATVDALTTLPAGPERDAALRRATTRLAALERQLPRDAKEAKGPSFGAEAERISAARFNNRTFSELTPAEKDVVNALVDQQQAGRATKVEVKNVMPGDTKLADIPAFRRSVQQTIDPQLKTITATDQALTAINDSLATGNFAAYRAAQVQFARAIAGAGDLSQKELKAAGADPSLLGGAADTISTLFSSTPTNDTQKKIRSTLQAIQTVARKQAQGEVDQQRAIALRSPGYNPAAVNEALAFPQLQGGTAPSAAAGAPIYARNPTTKERIMSTDGGVTWTQAR